MSFSHLLGQTQLEKVFEGIFPSRYEFFTHRGITGFLRSSHWEQRPGWEAGPPPRPQAQEAMRNKKSNNKKRNPAKKQGRKAVLKDRRHKERARQTRMVTRGR